ncbi:MAG: hypothetical protein P8175_10680 [Deltaproteobacteria bacterium]
MIETILVCLPDAYKGTIYRIGKPPELIAERITSGVIDSVTKEISWGLPEKSEYNPPGRPWLDYRDEPGRPLEAIAWCVEKQKSWTSEDPTHDTRSVRLQVEGTWEDFHHMEPVLVRKSDLRFNMYSSVEYPKDFRGQFIWNGTEFVVVAVIKIHFQPHTIRIASPETMVIKRLSRSLGTELLSYQLRQDSLKAMQQIAKDRLNACNILADSLRNAITKSGLIFSLVKQEIGYLRDQWESLLLDKLEQENPKMKAIEALNDILLNMNGGDDHLKKDLIGVQRRFLEISLPPGKGKNWVILQIEERWKDLFNRSPVSDAQRDQVWEIIGNLKRALFFGQDPKIIGKLISIPNPLKLEWVDLIYRDMTRFDASTLESLIKLLANPELSIPSRERSKKTLIQLKALAENMSQLESNTNFLLRQVLNGGDNEATSGKVSHGETLFE